MELSTIEQVSSKSLIDDVLWTRLVNRIVKDEDVTIELAERIMEQALGFLKLCALKMGSYSPSPLVDIGWHTFILYTREYADFCNRIAGHFIHHAPNDDPNDKTDCVMQGADCRCREGSCSGNCNIWNISSTEKTTVSNNTVENMRAEGIYVDEALWPKKANGGTCDPRESKNRDCAVGKCGQHPCGD